MARFAALLTTQPHTWAMYPYPYRINYPTLHERHQSAQAASVYAKYTYPEVEWEVRGDRLYGRYVP